MQYISVEQGTDEHPAMRVEDYQAPIPSDLHSLDGVAYSIGPHGPWIAIEKATGIFKQAHNHSHRRHHKCFPEYDPENKTIHWQDKEYHEIPAPEKMFTTQGQMYHGESLELWMKKHKVPFHKVKYDIKPGWIVLNVPKGFVKLAYKKIATDERGYPLIPDNTSYQEAIYWYVTMKLSFSKLLAGKLGGRGVNTGANLYSYMEQQWKFYRNKAYGELMMPTVDDIKNIKNDWNRLVPEYMSDEIFFDNMGEPQLVYSDYYHGY